MSFSFFPLVTSLPTRHAFATATVLLLSLVYPMGMLAQLDVMGQWSSVEPWPCGGDAWQTCSGAPSAKRAPTHAMLLPNGKVFYFSSYGGGLQPYLWDPSLGLNTAPATKTRAPFNAFCAGHSAMANGNLLITGGHICDSTGRKSAAIYNPSTDTWEVVPDMNDGRWYPTNTTLANGDVLVVSGEISPPGVFNKVPQVFSADSKTWRTLSSAALQQALYPYMYVAPNGKVFLAGPNVTSRYLDTSGTGAWSFVANTLSGKFRDYGSSVMYLPGKVLIVGGGGAGTGTLPTNTAETIDLNSPAPAWQWAAPMEFARRQLNTTLLPDGKVLVTGGTSSGGTFDDGTLAVRAAEIWDPATNTWSTLASSNTVYRGYHSFALLLPDATVLSAGGQRAGCSAEIFSPPYLFKGGARPSISSAPDSVVYGQTALVSTPDAVNISRATWLRLGAVTHGFNQDQRFLELTIASKVDGGLNVTFPSSANLSPPGYYMLFLLNGDGVPSTAKIIRISGAGTSVIAGKVTNISNGKPVAGATVKYSGGSTTTNTTGEYSLIGIVAGTYNVTASRSGFLSRTLQTTVPAGATNTLDFQLATSGIIAGTVTNSSGAAISGAKVTITGGAIPTSKTVTTNATGNYSSSWIPVGTNYSVTASATGFASQTVSPVTVSTGATNTINFALQ